MSIVFEYPIRITKFGLFSNQYCNTVSSQRTKNCSKALTHIFSAFAKITVIGNTAENQTHKKG